MKDLKSRLEAKRDEKSATSRADAGLTMNTDQALAYESGYEAGANEFIPLMVELAEVLELAMNAGLMGTGNIYFDARDALDKLNAWLGGE